MESTGSWGMVDAHDGHLYAIHCIQRRSGQLPPAPFPFQGFFAPVQNPPMVNTVKAGQAIPVKFSLGGDWGLAIFTAGSPASQPVSCTSLSSSNLSEETVSAGGSGL